MPPRERPKIETLKLKLPEVKSLDLEKKLKEKTPQEIQEDKTKKITRAHANVDRLNKILELRSSLTGGSGENKSEETERIQKELLLAQQEAEKLEGADNEIRTGGGRRIILPQDVPTTLPDPVKAPAGRRILLDTEIEESKKGNSEHGSAPLEKSGRRILLPEDMERLKLETANYRAQPVFDLYSKIASLQTQIEEKAKSGQSSRSAVETEEYVKLIGQKQELLDAVNKLDPHETAIYHWQEQAEKSKKTLALYKEKLALSPEEFKNEYGGLADGLRERLPEMIAQEEKRIEEDERIRDGLVLAGEKG